MTQLTAPEVLTCIQAKRSLQQAELSGINLEKSCLDQGNFAEASSPSLESAQLADAYFVGCNVRGGAVCRCYWMV